MTDDDGYRFAPPPEESNEVSDFAKSHYHAPEPKTMRAEDVLVFERYTEYLIWCVGKGIMGGKNDGANEEACSKYVKEKA